MTLCKRIKRLFQADMHEILDCIEDPEAAVKQALREMTAEAEKDEQTLEELRQGAERLGGEQKSKTETIAETEKQIDAAFSANEENLARTFIKRKLIASRRVLECQRELEQNALETKRIAGRLEERRTKIAAISEKLALCQAAQKEREVRREKAAFAAVFSQDAVSDEDVELAFIQERNRRQAA